DSNAAEYEWSLAGTRRLHFRYVPQCSDNIESARSPAGEDDGHEGDDHAKCVRHNQRSRVHVELDGEEIAHHVLNGKRDNTCGANTKRSTNESGEERIPGAFRHKLLNQQATLTTDGTRHTHFTAPL